MPEAGTFVPDSGGGSDANSNVEPQVDAGQDAAKDTGPTISVTGCAAGSTAAAIDAGPDSGLDGGVGVAACSGTWTGDVTNAAPLCGTGWHVCNGSEPALREFTYEAATSFGGCYAINAAFDSFGCGVGCMASVEAGVDTAANVDMGAIGSGCPYKFPGSGSCLKNGRIDFSENSGTGCNFAAGLTGVACCRNP
jgi:hypothetical protein